MGCVIFSSENYWQKRNPFPIAGGTNHAKLHILNETWYLGGEKQCGISSAGVDNKECRIKRVNAHGMTNRGGLKVPTYMTYFISLEPQRAGSVTQTSMLGFCRGGVGTC